MSTPEATLHALVYALIGTVLFLALVALDLRAKSTCATITQFRNVQLILAQGTLTGGAACVLSNGRGALRVEVYP